MGIPIIGDLIKEVVGSVGDVAGELIVDKDKKAQLQADLVRLELEMTDKAEQRLHEQLIAQTDINKTEAAHRSVFVAGWRPAVGWVSAAGLAAQAIVMPVLSMFGLPLPDLDTELLILTMSGILGVGAMRSYDKKQGTANDVLPIIKKKAEPSSGPTNLIPPGFGDPLPEDAPWVK